MSKIKPFIEKYDWKDVDYPLGKDDWIEFEDNHQTTALIVLYDKKEKIIYQTYISKHNPKREKQIIILMIQNGKGCHCFEVTRLSTLLRGITSTQNGDFYFEIAVVHLEK